MDPVYIPLLSALAGAIIGSLSSIATIIIQARISDRRERIRQAAMLALEDLKLHITHSAPGSAVLPMPIYLHYQLAVLNAFEKNDLTPERLRKITAENHALSEAAAEIDRQIRKGPRDRQQP